MIKQPEWGTRNVNEYFYESEARRIAILNEVFGDVELSRAEMQTLIWLAGWEEGAVRHVVSAVRKVMSRGLIGRKKWCQNSGNVMSRR